MGRALALARTEFREAWADVRFFLAAWAELAADLWKLRAVLLHGAAIVGGWALVTAGLASLLVPEVWLLSGGLFLLSLAGWGHLRVLFTLGAYALHRRPKS